MDSPQDDWPKYQGIVVCVKQDFSEEQRVVVVTKTGTVEPTVPKVF
jgi:hypothetical protein